MRPLLIDTNAYSAFMRGNGQIVEAIANADQLRLSAVVLGELLGGFAAGSREAANREELARFLASPRVSLLPINDRTADCYALVYSGCGAKASPFPAMICGSPPARWSMVALC